MATKAIKEKIPLDYLENMTKNVMIEEFNRMKTKIPWDGMMDIPARNLVKMIKKEICDA